MKLRVLKSVLLLALFLTVQVGVHVWHSVYHHTHEHEEGINEQHEDCRLCQADFFAEAEIPETFQFFLVKTELLSFYHETSSIPVIFSVGGNSRGPPEQF